MQVTSLPCGESNKVFHVSDIHGKQVNSDNVAENEHLLTVRRVEEEEGKQHIMAGVGENSIVASDKEGWRTREESLFYPKLTPTDQ